MIIISNADKSKKSIVYTLFSLLCLIILALLTVLIGYTTGTEFLFHNYNSTGTANDYPVIIIDAGHGGEDGGASGANGAVEKDLNLEISFILRDMLVANGVPVIMTRTEDILLYDRTIDYMGRKKVLDLKARLKISDENSGALFISIHMNAFPQKKYSGLQVYYSTNTDASKQLADLIQSTVKSKLQPDNMRKAKAAGSNIYLLHENQNTAVLIECGFLSNDVECEKLSGDVYQQQLSLALFCSIIEHLNEDVGNNYNSP